MTKDSIFRTVRRPIRSEQRIALDRAASSRRVDHDGHMHIPGNILSAAVVSPYYGNEIPGAAELGLRPERTYQLLRDPKELAKSAKSFDGKPLLVRHRSVTAGDHAHEIVAGAVNNVTFDAATGQLIGDLSIWDGTAIRSVQDGSSAALSCSYYYAADMTPGTYNGQKYDGVMRNIKANHVSLVSAGRVPTAAVGDEAFKQRRVTVAEDDNHDDDSARNRLLDYLASSGLSGKAMLAVIAILDGEDGDDDEQDNAPSDPEVAADRARQVAAAHRRVQRKRLAADSAAHAEREKRYPNWNRLGNC